MSMSCPINTERLWGSLMEMAQVGPGQAGGNRRLALTDEDRAGRDLFLHWARQDGFEPTTDAIGNLFVRRPGTDPTLDPVVMGSHLDTQPTGGRFDGVLGVLAGLEVLRSLNDHGIQTRHPIDVAVWMNEEGARFSPPMMGSGVWAGVFTRQEILDKQGQDGSRLGDELQRLGWNGDAPADHRQRPFAACFELHIEQGPVLEDAGRQIGVVTGARAQRWYEVTITGQEAHAGPTPMRLRRDALVGAARIVDLVNRIGQVDGDDGCATVGILDVHPHSRNVIPGRVFLTADLRHPDEEQLKDMHHRFHRETVAIGEAANLKVEIKDFWHSAALPFDAGLVDSVRDAARALGYSHQDIVSGAGHDTVYVARVCRAAMIFVPCEGGISHNEAENIQPGDAQRGCAVLFEAVRTAAGRG
ncbi:N-carbamoyl-L-amino-acid hydrolase [Natronocella acetinitrilica]|uniref:N-carbamoyl-L-amino-acid hydrolase n=1 Tax=Natronocella acetinitrilica TaxID=414046 RepID=A0AAE3G0L0_9GAMM|nr:Zn-dependent hydrolase [Natronocella acetinitrilica]MCP1673510.1 N-carbamoyl-L-amino-acid hydrolase [Natronocella acetinitrilica]